uniref:B30.2/SPRY domain-containing protein n=1 Tax=Astyanax mexicanus TaxID=7994 RepID=A0A3B1IPQ0_ASTMX
MIIQLLKHSPVFKLMSFLSISDSCQLTLDPDTANNHLLLSERNTVVTCSNTVQPYWIHRLGIVTWAQVLCRESVSGRCYWEVERRGDEWVNIAVSYKSISRKGGGRECVFGFNDQSWSLFCDSSRYKFRYNNRDTEISGVPVSSRVGVYVDHRAGTLSFYSISDTMTLIHRVQTTFTQPLYAGFGLTGYKLTHSRGAEELSSPEPAELQTQLQRTASLQLQLDPNWTDK